MERIETIKRLRDLADYVDAQPDELVNLRYIGRVEECGTCACAIGHAVLGPWGKEAGLELVLEEDYADLLHIQDAEGRRLRISEAGRAMFGLDRGDSDVIFDMRWRRDEGGDATDKEVFRHRVERFAAVTL